MVRLSLVNLYLHGFAEPSIFEYDTLTSEDKWNEYYNVILANPPFMSPKGGIRPHKKFSIESSRSEVLFVDYIAEHLTQFGRAAVIVPEGIIFQSGTAYKSLRKMLVEKCLYTVVSLPAGVFNPYSGVKTSILLLDKQLAQKTDNILFIKIENDGFDLGAQRRPMDKNDLPASAKAIKEYKESLITGKNFLIEDYPNLLLAPKSKISETGDYNLTGERYREQVLINFTYPIYPLSEVCDIYNGSTPLKKEKTFWDGGSIPWFTVDDIRKSGRIISKTEKYITQKALNKTSITLLPKHSVLLCCTASVGEYAFTEIEVTTNQQFNGLVVKKTYEDKLLPKFLFLIASTFKEKLLRLSGKTSFNFVSVSSLKSIAIPLPPIEVQREMVQEIESYQKIIDAARQIVDNYKPRIEIDPKWEVVRVDEVFSKSDKTINPETIKGAVTYIGLENITQNTGELTGDFVTKTPSVIRSLKNIFQKGSILYGKLRPNLNKVWLADRDGICSTDIFVIKPNSNKIISGFYANIFRSESFNERVLFQIKGTQLPRVGWTSFADLKIPFPPLEVQKEIVARIEREQELVNANKELIKIFESKIKTKISSVWGEESE
jgi:type I restriction enzyme M protein